MFNEEIDKRVKGMLMPTSALTKLNACLYNVAERGQKSYFLLNPNLFEPKKKMKGIFEPLCKHEGLK